MSTPMRSLKASLATAQDDQITRVVAFVDALPSRGPADDLIAPLRPRLQQLRPKRPCGLLRLLFTPLDPLIVPAGSWQRGSVMMPRTAIGPIGAVLLGAIRDAGEYRAQAITLDASDHDAICRLGQVVWPIAAALCATGLPATAWQIGEDGFTAQDHVAIVALLGAVLGYANEIEAAVAEPPGDLQDAAIRVVLRRAALSGPAGFGAAATILLARLSATERVISCAAEIAGSADYRAAADHAIETTLGNIGSVVGTIEREGASPVMDISRVATVLDGLEVCSAAKPERLKRIESIRRYAGDACQQVFQQTATTGLLRHLEQLSDDPADTEIAALEASARDLRRVEACARRFGVGGGETLLKSCRDIFRSGKLTALGLADRVRMLEIMGATDEAMALLTAETAKTLV